MPGIESYLKDYSGIYEAATIKRSPTGASQYYAVNDDTSTIAVQVGEASTFTVQDFTFSQVQMDAYKFGTVVKDPLVAGAWCVKLGARCVRRCSGRGGRGPWYAARVPGRVGAG